MSIAENFEVVADAVYKKGVSNGKKAEHDEFWDALLENGNRKSYANCFINWNREIFYPSYDLKPISSMGNMFQFFEQNVDEDFDLSARLNECGISLDLSQCVTGGGYVFYWTSFSKIPTVDFTGLNDGEKLTYTFGRNYRLKEIEKLIVKETNVFNVTFDQCSRLEKMIVEGILGSAFDVRSSPLNKESIISVVNALSTTTTGLAVTFKKTAVNSAFGINVDDATTYPEGSEYYNLRYSKPDWTFNYL
jgi:hypothetical protein